MKEKLYIIYKITNIKNSKCYIGSSDKTLSDVMTYFKWAVSNNKNDLPIYEDIRLYTFKYFKWEILKTVNEKYLSDQLDFYIKQYKSEYNNIPEKVDSGRGHTEETKKKISKSHMGLKHSEETRKKLSISHMGARNINYGIKVKEKTRRALSETKKGIPKSDEIRKKISDTMKGKAGRIVSDEERERMRLMRDGKKCVFNVERYKKVLELKRAKVPNVDILKMINIPEMTLYRYINRMRDNNELD